MPQRALAAGIGFGLVTFTAPAAVGQLLRFQELGSGQYIMFQGGDDAILINATTLTPVPSTPHVWNAPAETPTSGGGQTGGGFEDGGVTVGECFIESEAHIVEQRAGESSMTFSFFGHAWYNPVTHHALSYAANQNTFGGPAGILVVTGPGPMTYTEVVTGDVSLGQFRLHTGPHPTLDPYVTGGVIVPGTYYIRMDDGVGVSANFSSPNNLLNGSWTFTIPTPSSAVALALGGLIATRRRR